MAQNMYWTPNPNLYNITIWQIHDQSANGFFQQRKDTMPAKVNFYWVILDLIHVSSPCMY